MPKFDKKRTIRIKDVIRDTYNKYKSERHSKEKSQKIIDEISITLNIADYTAKKYFYLFYPDLKERDNIKAGRPELKKAGKNLEEKREVIPDRPKKCIICGDERLKFSITQCCHLRPLRSRKSKRTAWYNLHSTNELQITN